MHPRAISSMAAECGKVTHGNCLYANPVSRHIWLMEKHEEKFMDEAVSLAGPLRAGQWTGFLG